MTAKRGLSLAILLGLALPAAVSAQEVRDRESEQQQRISQGIESGQVTGRGASTLETREAHINASRRADLRAHGGHLTVAEQHHLNARQDSVSKQIYVDKHNDVAQRGVVPDGR